MGYIDLKINENDRKLQKHEKNKKYSFFVSISFQPQCFVLSSPHTILCLLSFALAPIFYI